LEWCTQVKIGETMTLAPEIMALLHQGRTLAARAIPRRKGWHAWIWVRPLMRCGRTFQQAIEEWTRTRHAAAQYDGTIQRFQVRYVELSDRHLEDRWFRDMDLAIRERPVVDEWQEVTTEVELAELLTSWGVDSCSLDDPMKVNYPDPPRV
jgi:hypothetical protein